MGLILGIGQYTSSSNQNCYLQVAECHISQFSCTSYKASLYPTSPLKHLNCVLQPKNPYWNL